MNEDNTQKLAKLKKIGKILKAASLIASLVLIPAILIFLFAPVTNLMSDVASKYTRGYNYYGWQMTFLGCGYPPFQILCLFEEPGTAAGDYIPDKYDFGFNIVTTMALFIPFVAMIIAGLVGMKMKNRGKAVGEFAVAAAIIVSVTILLNVASLGQRRFEHGRRDGFQEHLPRTRDRRGDLQDPRLSDHPLRHRPLDRSAQDRPRRLPSLSTERRPQTEKPKLRIPI